MRSIIVAWYNPGKRSFEDHVPLLFVGKRNQKLNYSNSIDVIFLEGLTKLSEAYKINLKSLGFRLIDAENIYTELSDQYFKLNRFGDYEKKCFLRWLVIQRLFANEQIIHYDGDIVFNESPDKILEMFKGTTFALHGCPAVTSISDSKWYEQYESELNMFHADIEGYSEKAWVERKGWEITKYSKWAGERHRKIITSDQDFVSHLFHTNRLIQDDIEAIKNKAEGYILIQNPLVIEEHQNESEYIYRRVNDVDYINGKRVLLWHMQSDFNFYLALFLYRQKYTFFRGTLKLNENKENKLLIFIYKVISKITGHHERGYIYRQFFDKGDFSKIFRNEVWWRRSVFP